MAGTADHQGLKLQIALRQGRIIHGRRLIAEYGLFGDNLDKAYDDETINGVEVFVGQFDDGWYILNTWNDLSKEFQWKGPYPTPEAAWTVLLMLKD